MEYCCSGETYLEILQVRGYDICSHLLVINDIAAMLGMSAHGPGTCAFVVAAVDLFGGQGETAETTKEGCRWLHCNDLCPGCQLLRAAIGG